MFIFLSEARNFDKAKVASDFVLSRFSPETEKKCKALTKEVINLFYEIHQQLSPKDLTFLRVSTLCNI